MINKVYEYYFKMDKTIIFRSILSGIFIGLGCIFMLVVKSDILLPKSISSLLSGLVFCIGLFLVLCFTSNLFTGSCINFKHVLSNKMSLLDFAKLLATNYIFNFVGIALIAYCASRIGFQGLATSIAYTKFSKPLDVLFIQGFLCNILVCLSVFLHIKNRSGWMNTLLSAMLSVIFTITMFVACGFEHSIADMFFVFFVDYSILSFGQVLFTLLFISFANLIGGLFIATLFHHADL